MRSFLHDPIALYKRHERRITSLALVGGFIFDSFTLKRIDLLFENLAMLSYLVVSGIGIALLNYYHEHPPRWELVKRVENLLPLAIQFTFGGLFSAFFIFYYRGASFSSSWPFLVVLLFLLVGNEFFREHYKRLTFQVSIYFLAIFSFFIFFIPVILKTMGAGVFILSGLVSLIFIYLFCLGLFKVVPTRYQDSKVGIVNSIIIIFSIINALYFANVIPPMPLSIKNPGIYHSIQKSGSDYVAKVEKKRWFESLPFFFHQTLSIKPGGSLYAWSPVFAPTDLDTNIVHDWQYFDERAGHWVSLTKITFSIVGGRNEGYRGFSKKDKLNAGKWRVDVETPRGQIIGRIRFDIEITPTPVPLETKTI